MAREGVGAIVFSPLGQGLLTDRYLGGVPDDSRVRRGLHFSEELITDENLERVRAPQRDRAGAAARRWPSLRSPGRCATSASPRRCSAPASVEQLEQNVAALQRIDFEPGELEEIDRYAVDGGINIWEQSSSS